jgi:hypothetical protein
MLLSLEAPGLFQRSSTRAYSCERNGCGPSDTTPPNECGSSARRECCRLAGGVSGIAEFHSAFPHTRCCLHDRLWTAGTSSAATGLSSIENHGLDHRFGRTMSVRAEVSKHERGCRPFDTSGRTDIGRTDIRMHMAETMIVAM